VAADGELSLRARLLRLLADAHCLSSVERELLLEQAVRSTMPWAERVASCYARKGVESDDLRQVAFLALTQAARRFDSTRPDADFLAFALTTVRGELRRYFRDHGWMIRPTRRVQEVRARANAVVEVLTSELHRPPRPADFAVALGEPLEVVTEALAAEGCFTPLSLDRLVSSDEGSTATLGELLGGHDPDLSAAEDRASLDPLLRDLCERDRTMLSWRYDDQLSQREIAARLGVSQMQVSRRLARILAQLREALLDLDPETAVA
jgi:RNA polymerase sigma-B factor